MNTFECIEERFFWAKAKVAYIPSTVDLRLIATQFFYQGLISPHIIYSQPPLITSFSEKSI